MMRLALAFFKPWITARPIHPSEYCSHRAFFDFCRVFDSAEAGRHSAAEQSNFIQRASLSILTRFISLTTVYSLKVLVPI